MGACLVNSCALNLCLVWCIRVWLCFVDVCFADSDVRFVDSCQMDARDVMQVAFFYRNECIVTQTHQEFSQVQKPGRVHVHHGENAHTNILVILANCSAL